MFSQGAVSGIVLVAALVTGCAHGPAAPGVTPTPSSLFTSPHFVIRYPASETGNVAAMAGALEDAYARILSDLRAEGMPMVDVTLYVTHGELETAVRALAGPVPAYASGLVTSERDIHMMSP